MSGKGKSRFVDCVASFFSRAITIHQIGYVNQGLSIGFLISQVTRVSGRNSKCRQFTHFQPMFSQLDLDSGFDNINGDILSLNFRKIKKISREIMKSGIVSNKMIFPSCVKKLFPCFFLTLYNQLQRLGNYTQVDWFIL